MKLIFKGNYFHEALIFFPKVYPIKMHVKKLYYVTKSKLLKPKFAQTLKLLSK